MASARAVAARLMVPRILWLSMLTSIVFYGGILFSGAVPPPPETPAIPLPMLLAIALSCAVASFLVPVFLHRSALAKVEFEVDELPLQEAPTGYRTAGTSYRRLSPSVYDSAMRLYSAPFIVSLALSEAVALFGFIGAYTGQPIPYCLPFLGVGALLIAVRFPTWRAALAPIEKQTSAVAPPPQ